MDVTIVSVNACGILSAVIPLNAEVPVTKLNMSSVPFPPLPFANTVLDIAKNARTQKIRVQDLNVPIFLTNYRDSISALP